uniref:Zinc finger CCCH domain-containing protein 14 n=1 Tax=Ornithorhynchus anatinus TaxID=9258 RepID=A0A6I8PER7_ORNAN
MSRFLPSSSPVVDSGRPVELGDEPAGLSSVENLNHILKLLLKISNDVAEIKRMKATVLTIEKGMGTLSGRVVLSEEKISSLEVKLSEFEATVAESKKQFEDFQEIEIHSKTADLKIIGCRNIGKGVQQRELFSRLQIDSGLEENVQVIQDCYDMDSMVHADTRSFILKKPKLAEETAVPSNQESVVKNADALRVLSGRLIQTRELVPADKPASPKFIVTLDGVPSPPGYMSDQEEEEICDEGNQDPENQAASANKGIKGLRAQLLPMLNRQHDDPDGNFPNTEESELNVLQKPEKLPERCKYWPACKNGDECAYHHPTSPCKAFPNCKFADKCLFIHPNCKYDSKCTKPECPYTHASRRIPVLPPKTAPTITPCNNNHLCRYFPACKKMECPFYHPKHCRFNTQCTRPDCTFYHPAITVPPRHALKWTRPQTSE